MSGYICNKEIRLGSDDNENESVLCMEYRKQVNEKWKVFGKVI